MRQSDSITDLSAALVAAQAEFSAVPKGKENPFFKSKYADLAAVKASAQPVLAAHGLAVTQWPSHDDAGHDVLCSMLVHTSGQFIAGEMLLHPVKNDPQAQGSALTYARRYSFMAILGLVADEDDDGNAASQAPRARAAKAAPKEEGTSAQGRNTPTAAPSTPRNHGPAIHRLAGALKITPDRLDEILLAEIGSVSANDVTDHNVEKVREALKREPKA